jgi:hypothetical protein
MQTAVEVRSAGDRGDGLYACRDFPAGSAIRTINVIREVTPEAPLASGEDGDHCMHLLGRSFLVGQPDCFVNHRCEPNAYKRFGPTEVTMMAMVDIAAGDEITYDYMLNTHGGGTWTCACGAPTCRKATFASFFDLSPELQAKYRPYLAEGLIAAHPDRF